MTVIDNLYDQIPRASDHELFHTLLEGEYTKIERIVSYGQASPAEGWYDQVEDEWVLILEGAAVIAFEDGRRVKLEKGGFLEIPKHQKHKVAWTDPSHPTIWLAVFSRR